MFLGKLRVRRTATLHQDAEPHGDLQPRKVYWSRCGPLQPLAVMLREFLRNRTSGLLFCTSTGAQLLQSNTAQENLYPILKKLEHAKGGFNTFRRFRASKLKKSDCSGFLQRFWSGHAYTHVSERYTKRP